MTGTLFRKFRKPITNLVKLFHLKVQLANICTLLISAVTAIDTSGIDMVCELRKNLEKQSLQVRIANHCIHHTHILHDILESDSIYLILVFSMQLVLANPVGSVTEKLHQSKVLESFGLNGLYLTVGEAVADISALWKARP